MLTRLTPWVAGLSLFLCGVVAWGQEDRLRNQRGLLEGIWTIDSIVQNGETLGADLIRAKVAEEGKLAFGTRMVTMIRPGSGQARTIAYRLDPSISPRGIDLFGEDDSLLQGIYRFDGDKVIFCLRDQKDGERPTEFASEYGDQTILMTLRVTLPEIAEAGGAGGGGRAEAGPHAYAYARSGPGGGHTSARGAGDRAGACAADHDGAGPVAGPGDWTDAGGDVDALGHAGFDHDAGSSGRDVCVDALLDGSAAEGVHRQDLDGGALDGFQRDVLSAGDEVDAGGSARPALCGEAAVDQ